MTRITDDEHEQFRLNFSRCETVMSLLKLLNASETFTSYLKYKLKGVFFLFEIVLLLTRYQQTLSLTKRPRQNDKISL